MIFEIQTSDICNPLRGPLQLVLSRDSAPRGFQYDRDIIGIF